MSDLTPEQKQNVARSLRVTRKRGSSARERKALLLAEGVESNYKDLSYGDRDSVGILQQRPSQGWGPGSEPLERDVAQFLQRAEKINRSGFKGSAGQLAQAVQRSAFPDRYDQRSPEAEALLRAFGGGASTGATARTSSMSPAAGGDQRAQRGAAIAQFVTEKNSDPVDFALTLKQLQAAAGQQSAAPSSGGARRGSPSRTIRTGGIPVGRRGKVIGTPHAGTHTLGNWQSDNAVDIGVPAGTPMVALQDGVVVKVRQHPQDGGRFAGDQITVRGANGNEYFYAHGVAGVKPGQRIRKGQVLGRTGSANGVPHLHFGQMRGDPRQHT